MNIIKLEPEQPAPVIADCINIDTFPSGKARLSGNVLCGADSIALVGVMFDSAGEAEQQGLAWANEQGVQILYVTYDAPMSAD